MTGSWRHVTRGPFTAVKTTQVALSEVWRVPDTLAYVTSQLENSPELCRPYANFYRGKNLLQRILKCLKTYKRDTDKNVCADFETIALHDAGVWESSDHCCVESHHCHHITLNILRHAFLLVCQFLLIFGGHLWWASASTSLFGSLFANERSEQWFSPFIGK